MPITFKYQCTDCDKTYEISPKFMVCPDCTKIQRGDTPLRGILTVKLTGEVGPNFNVHELLPVDKEFFPSIHVGDTPFWKPGRLNKAFGFSNLFLKNDGANPTGSLKDRASHLVCAFAKQHQIKQIVLASTGNAASSMAGIGAAAGLKVTIFLPQDAPIAKMIQVMQYGAKLILVNGNYDKAYKLSLEYTRFHSNCLSRNTAYNPLTIEGKKTVALEIFKQLGKVPKHIFVPTGDGVILAGVYKGFTDLKELNIIGSTPTVYAVQAAGSDAIYQALHKGKFEKICSDTIADSIKVDVPQNGYYALKLLKKYKGQCIKVSDDEILKSQKLLSSTTGLFVEPAAAASFAGFLQVKKNIGKDDSIVILTTGTGLKDTEAAKVKLPPLPEPINQLADIVD
ncbi:MAG: threonine synthase [Bacteriovoracaceae bacterium]|nr:threonine synthase [Bacteriovoracaceae bacterium]